MSNSKWYALKMWLSYKLARVIPESVKRQVLYCLLGRVAVIRGDGPGFDEWTVTYEELYYSLRD